MAKQTGTANENALQKKVAKKNASSSRGVKSAARRTVTKAVRKAVLRTSATVHLPKGPIWQWSAVDTAGAIRSGMISSVEVTTAHIERMQAVNPNLNAVVVDLSAEALEAAKAADKARARRGELGLLHGVPITI